MKASSVLALLAAAAGIAVAASAPPAAAEIAPWDQARASALAEQLVRAADELYDSFYKQPQPPGTPRSRRDYYRLKHDLRRIESEARGLAADLERGEGREQTQAAYEDLMVTVRWARERAQSVFTTQDVQQRAAAVGALLDQLAPFYEPDAAAPR
jgi:hypothetical protein